MSALSLQALPRPTVTTWPTLGWLNTGVLHISPSMEVIAYNLLAVQCLDLNIPIGEPYLLNTDVATTQREEYQLLETILHAKTEYRNAIVTLQQGPNVRHLLIDSFADGHWNGDITGKYVLMKDIGDFTDFDKQMQKTDKLATVGKIAAGIAHEIRNPLTSIRGFLQILRTRLGEKKSDAELKYVDVMLKELARVNNLVGELLLLSKPHQEKKMCGSLHDLMQDLNPLIESQALLANIEYQYTCTKAHSAIMDAQLIKQVILNLTKNAMEAMESGGVLSVRVSGSSTHVKVEVSDTGPGIPYYEMDKIFDAFFTTKEQGTGLGLPICQRIVSDHGGEIHVSSKGFGTTFTVTLPVAQDGNGC